MDERHPESGTDPLATGPRAFQQDAALMLRELVGVLRRQQEVLRDSTEVAKARAAIRTSRSWRALERFRALRLHVQRQQVALRRALGNRRPWRNSGVPDAARRAAPGVNVSGYITAESGMGEAVRSSIQALELAGVPVALENLQSGQRAQDASYREFSSTLPHPFNLVHLNADNMEWFAGRKGRRYFRDRYTIGFWFWELSKFRPDLVPAFRFVDEVWAASRFTQSCVQEASPVPVVHMPPGIAVPSPPSLGRAHFGIPPRGFVFLFMFDVSSQTERKNPLALLRAFRQAGFAARDAVLVIKFTNAGFDRAGTRRLYEEALGLNVLMLDGFMSRDDLGGLLNAADAYVSLHRAEGFGLTIAEAMALGKPVVATAYSGNMDFMNPGNSYPVDYRLVTLACNYGPYPRGFTWADPDVAQAAQIMRTLVANPAAAAEIGARGAADVRGQFSPAAAAERMKRRLAELTETRHP